MNRTRIALIALPLLLVATAPAAATTAGASSSDLAVTVDMADMPRPVSVARGVRYSHQLLRVEIENAGGTDIARDSFEVRVRFSRTIRPAHFMRVIFATPANQGRGTRGLYAGRRLPAPDRTLPVIRRTAREYRARNLQLGPASDGQRSARLWLRVPIPLVQARAGLAARVSVVPLGDSEVDPPEPVVVNNQGAGAGAGPSAPGAGPVAPWTGRWSVAFDPSLDAPRFGTLVFGREQRRVILRAGAMTPALRRACGRRTLIEGAYFYSERGILAACARGRTLIGAWLGRNGSRGTIRIVQPAPDVCRAAGASACWRGVYRPGGTGPA
ncbi:MAG: hypothetical protein RLN63_03840, partial [Miltoncostaeaceae bacterium]